MNSSEALGIILRSTPKDGHYSVRRLIEDALKENGQRITISVDEKIGQIEKDVGNRLAKAQAAFTGRGAMPILESLDDKNQHFRWTSLGTRGGLQRNWLRSRCLRWLDSLDSHAFEKACALALKANGAEEACASRKSGDFNIDFYGLLPAHSKASLILTGARGCRIVGQAKKYNSRVPREKIMSLIDGISALCKRHPDAKNAAPVWFYDQRVPIVGLVVGFSGFQSGARSYAADHGVILLDGHDLAYLLADRKFLRWATDDAAFNAAIAHEFSLIQRIH